MPTTAFTQPVEPALHEQMEKRRASSQSPCAPIKRNEERQVSSRLFPNLLVSPVSLIRLDNEATCVPNGRVR